MIIKLSLTIIFDFCVKNLNNIFVQSLLIYSNIIDRTQMGTTSTKIKDTFIESDIVDKTDKLYTWVNKRQGAGSPHIFKYLERIFYKSKYIIYKEVTFSTDIEYMVGVISSTFTYKYLIFIPFTNEYLFLKDDKDPIYYLCGGLQHEATNTSSILFVIPKSKIDLFSEAIIYVKELSDSKKLGHYETISETA